MKNNGPKKLYSLAILKKTSSHIFHTEAELDEFLEKYYKYYKKNKVKTIFSNLFIDRKKYPSLIEVTAQELERLEPTNRTLEDIDSITSIKDNALHVKYAFNVNDLSGSPLVIAYRSNKTYKTLPVIYKKSAEYLEIKNLTEKIINLAFNQKDFIFKINTNTEFNNDLSMRPYLEKIINHNYRFQLFTKTESKDVADIAKKEVIDDIKEFIKVWCNPKDSKGYKKFSYRRFRDLIGFVINYENSIIETDLNDDIERFEQLNFLDKLTK